MNWKSFLPPAILPAVFLFIIKLEDLLSGATYYLIVALGELTCREEIMIP